MSFRSSAAPTEDVELLCAMMGMLVGCSICQELGASLPLYSSRAAHIISSPSNLL